MNFVVKFSGQMETRGMWGSTIDERVQQIGKFCERHRWKDPCVECLSE